MKFVIKDEIRGRMRVRVKQNEMTCREADILQYYFDGQKCVTMPECICESCDCKGAT